MKDKCHLTFEPLLNEAFLIYHCGHQVHTKAAILEEISICRDPARKVRLEDVKQERGPRTGMAHESHESLSPWPMSPDGDGPFHFGPWNPEKSIEKMDKFEPGIKGNEKIGADLKARTKKLVTETSK